MICDVRVHRERPEHGMSQHETWSLLREERLRVIETEKLPSWPGPAITSTLIADEGKFVIKRGRGRPPKSGSLAGVEITRPHKSRRTEPHHTLDRVQLGHGCGHVPPQAIPSVGQVPSSESLKVTLNWIRSRMLRQLKGGGVDTPAFARYVHGFPPLEYSQFQELFGTWPSCPARDPWKCTPPPEKPSPHVADSLKVALTKQRKMFKEARRLCLGQELDDFASLQHVDESAYGCTLFDDARATSDNVSYKTVGEVYVEWSYSGLRNTLCRVKTCMSITTMSWTGVMWKMPCRPRAHYLGHVVSMEPTVQEYASQVLDRRRNFLNNNNPSST